MITKHNSGKARVAEVVDARDLKSLGAIAPCRFDSGPGHFCGGRCSFNAPTRTFLTWHLLYPKMHANSILTVFSRIFRNFSKNVLIIVDFYVIKWVSVYFLICNQ